MKESVLRKYVRQLLKEDPMGFVHDLAASDKFGDKFRGGQVGKEAGSDIKRAFNKNADHQFLSTLDTVHWTDDFYGIENMKGRGKDELSTTMTLPGDSFEPAAGLPYGLWIKGRITLATNDQDKMYSGFHGDYGVGPEGDEEAIAQRDRSSGRNKRPSVSKDYSRYGQLQRGDEYMEKMARDGIPYVLDQSTWNPVDAGWSNNEALVDNWRPRGIIVVKDDVAGAILKTAEKLISGGQSPPSGNTAKDIDYFTAGVTKKIMLTSLDLGVPIYDTDRNKLWSPVQKKTNESLLRKLVYEQLGPGPSVMIPPPPPESARAAELSIIQAQQNEPYNSPELQGSLDKSFAELFNSLIKGLGYTGYGEFVKKLKNEIKPIITFHKDYFSSKRPDAVAADYRVDFESDHLESAMTPSYPSGHAAQAYYLAHKLSRKFPELKEDFYELANMVAQSRIDRGVHFPSDIEAGKLLALKLAGGGGR